MTSAFSRQRRTYRRWGLLVSAVFGLFALRASGQDQTVTGNLTVTSSATASSASTGAVVVGNNVGLSGTVGGTSYFGGGLSLGGSLAFKSEYNQITFPMALGVAGGITGDDGQYKALKLYHGNSIRFGIGNDPAYTNEKMRIDSSGNVGIGTTTPSAKLEVAGNIKNSFGTVTMPLGDWKTLVVAGSANQFYPVRIPTSGNRRDFVEIMQPDVHADGTWYGSLHFIAQFNNDGWGSVVSVDKLLLNTNTGANSYVARFADAAYGMIPVVWLRGDQSYLYRVTSDGDLSVIGYDPNTLIYTDASGQYVQYVSPMAAPDSTVPVITANDVAGDLNIVGNLVVHGVVSGTSYIATNGAVIGGATGLSLSAGGSDQNVTVSPSGSGATILNGNVGIGIAIPQEKLEVAGYIGVPANGGEFMPSAWNRGNAGGIIFASAANPDGTGWSYGSRIVNNDYGDGLGLSFDVLYATNWTNDALFISGRSGRVGNIGIGTTSPSAKLEVNGNTQIDGDLTVSGNFSAPGYVATNGAITGGSNGLSLAAGGTNQNVTISPSGTGVTVLNGNVGIGTASPQDPLHVYTANTGGVSITAATGSGGNENVFAGGHNLAMYAMNYTGGLALSQTADNVGLIQAFTSSGTKGAGAQSENGTLLLNPGGGNVGVGTVHPDTALTVKGRIHATEVVVDTGVTANDLKVRPKAWADDVFENGRQLEPLSQVEKDIKVQGHLPGIPSAREVAQNGISVADMQARLLAKIEELTLHQIEQEKLLHQQADLLEAQGTRIERLEAENAALKSR